MDGVLAVLGQVLLPAAVALAGSLVALAGYFLQRGQLALARAQEARMASDAANERAVKLLELIYPDLASNDEARQTWALSLVSHLSPEIGRAFLMAVSENNASSPLVRRRALAIARAGERYGPLAWYEIHIYTAEPEPDPEYGDSASAELPYATQVEQGLRDDGFPGEIKVSWGDVSMVRGHGMPGANVILFEEPFEREAAECLQRVMAQTDPEGRVTLQRAARPSIGILSVVLSRTADRAGG